MIAASALAGSSGGLVYHARALQYRDTLWRPFRENLQRFLSPWAREVAPRCDRLVLVGPSAGYSLPPAFVRSFPSVEIIEPDVLARFLFGRRFGPCTQIPLDFLVYGSTELRAARLASFLSERPRAAIVFSNVLGQVATLRHIEEDTPAFLAEKEAMRDALRRHHWLTFHDRLSGDVGARPGAVIESARRATDEEIVEGLFADAAGELVDHLVDGYTDPSDPHVYLPWSILPTQHHIIELAWHRPG